MIKDTHSTICALITPAGRGAVAVIRLSGKNTFPIIGKIFQPRNKKKKISDAQTHSVHLGTILDGNIQLDEVLVSVFRNPGSYTGEDVIEISCHGSVFIQQQLLKLLMANGARMAEPGEFTMRAFLNGKLDLSQAEAVADIIASENEGSHKLALQQMRGEYSTQIKRLRDELIQFAAMIELELDFSEEDVEFANRSELKKLVENLQLKIKDLLSSFELGNVLKNGVPVVIAGKPNTGKSTLLNVLLMEERAIVSEIAGTTRDTIEDEITLQGIRFRFVDTAGIRETKDVIEVIGVERTLEKIKTATIVIYLFDPGETNLEELTSITTNLKAQNANVKLFVVANKIDMFNESDVKIKYAGIENLICISAKKKLYTHKLQQALVDYILDAKSISGENFVSNARHAWALQQAHDSLQHVLDGLAKSISTDFIAADIRHAINNLGEITGEVTNDHMLDFIFSKFCIGK